MNDPAEKRVWGGACVQPEPQPPASALRHESLQRTFKAVHQSFLQRALHQMRAEGISDLYPGTTSLLLHLNEEDGLTLSELARRCDLEPSTLTPLVDELEKRDLVRRQRAVGDRRLVMLFLTERGSELAPRLHRMWLQIQETALLGISAEDLAALHRILARIVTNLNDHGDSA